MNTPTRTLTVTIMQPTYQIQTIPSRLRHTYPQSEFSLENNQMQENLLKEMERQSDGTYIKKGPWTAEEDEILTNFVSKYGPRDWSSIRSKGLLPRTGKSCRLRWVNKLRPNLKTCKFTAEEERIVIESQARFGNKWAKIATFLKGRTDNDVKNFWSTRRKRLERMLQNPSPKSQRNNKGKSQDHAHVNVPRDHHEFAFLEVPESSSVSVDSSTCNYGGELNMNVSMVSAVSFPELVVDPTAFQIELSDYEPNHGYPFCVPGLEPQLDMTLVPDCPVLGAQPVDDHFFLAELPLGLEGNMENPSTPDSFFEDFPDDMFDHLEPLPSPSEW